MIQAQSTFSPGLGTASSGQPYMLRLTPIELWPGCFTSMRVLLVAGLAQIHFRPEQCLVSGAREELISDY